MTAVELLPIHHIADEQHLAGKGLTNYWGYSSIGYLAPHALYAATGRRGEQVKEFKGMVKALHRAGIEVILDVVYNHTAEGNHLGPMLAFKGIDNLSYYRTVPGDARHYMDYTGTGNSLNPAHPSVLRLIMDSLRYFVIECHVDGFRFDLASALARELHEVDRLSAFFDIIHQDPVLSQVKLIAEPWDVGEGGYQVGNFPVLWTEWNGMYRDTMRDFWRSQASVGEFASRFTGSSDLYETDGRRPFASINFVTAHDGFTLRDLVTYNEKHNEANLEENRDGDSHNRSWNHGVEGETDDPAVNALRERQQRNFLATLFLSQGVPMLLGGDEIARTQGGNNNAYCQDNEICWIDWDLDERAERLLAFTRRLIELRREHPVFHRADFLTGQERLGSGAPDVWWFRPDGRKMTQRNWRDDNALTLGVFLNGSEIPTQTAQGAPVIDDTFLILFNAWEGADPLHAPRRHVRAALGARALDRRAGARGGRGGAPRPRRRPGRGPLARRPPPRRVMAEPRATYRLQLGPGLGFREARELVPYLARPRRLPPLPLAVAAGARAARRTATTSSTRRGSRRTLGGEDELRALAAAARARRRARHRPEPHGGGRREPVLARSALAGKFFDLDWRTGSHRRFFDVGELAGVRMEDPEVWEVTHAKVVELARDGRRRRPPGRPSGRAREPAPLPRAAARVGIERVWVEKILEPGEPLRRLAGRGDDRLRVPERRDRALRRPRRPRSR